MKPYYEQAGIQIFHGDCRDILPTLEPGSVDLVLTDPPYGVGWETSRRKVAFGKIVGDDDADAIVPLLLAALRPLKQHRHIYAFGRWSDAGLPLGGLCELIWDKGLNGIGGSGPWALGHEYITFGVKANKAQRAMNDGLRAARLRRGTVLHYRRPSGVAVDRHPTEKPVDLLRELVEASSLLGELVLDPFCGSGSTLVAALLEGRRAIGIEIEERYAEIAARRLSQQVLPLGV